MATDWLDDLYDSESPSVRERPAVFCRDCHWYVDVVLARNCCAHPHAYHERNTPLGRVLEHATPAMRNAGNDCLDFQKRRFWAILWNGALVSVCGLLVTWGLLMLLLWRWRGLP